MELVPKIAQQLDGIIAAEGPAPRAQDNLDTATKELWESWQTLSGALEGSESSDAWKITTKLLDAMVEVNKVKAALAAAASGVIAVRAKLVGSPPESAYRPIPTGLTPTARPKKRFRLSPEADTDAKPPIKPITERFTTPVYATLENGELRPGAPDPKTQEKMTEIYQHHLAHVERMKAFIDGTPNVNEEYAEEITEAQEILAELNLPSAPVAMVSAENFSKITKLGGHDLPSNVKGMFLHGRVIVNAEELYDTFPPGEMRREAMVDFLVHEQAHASGYNPQLLIRSKVNENDEVSYGWVPIAGGFLEFDFADEKVKGGCFEEGWAELTAKELSNGPRPMPLNAETMTHGNIVYIGHHHPKQPRLGDETVEVPMDYAMRVRLGDNVTARYFPKAGPLAYGIKLLDERLPGMLIETMNAARVDPKYKAEVAYLIDSLEPGLYKKLHDLPYTPEGITQFLCHIGEALFNRYGY